METIEVELYSEEKRVWGVSPLSFYSEYHDQVKFSCPTCMTYGEPDSRVTASWSQSKQVGFCHRCSSTFIPNTEVTDLENSINKFLRSRGTLSVNAEEASPINYVDISTEMSEFGKNYLNNRYSLLPLISDRFMLREVNKLGIIAPMFYNGEIVSYCIRRYVPKDKRKYEIARGFKFPHDITNRLGTKIMPEITLVEGYFDAIAALLMGYPNPIAISGCHVSKYMANILSSSLVENVICMLDEWHLSVMLQKSVRQNMPTISSTVIEKTYGDDPEEIFIKRLNRGQVSGEDIVNRLNLVEKYKESP